LAGNLVKPLLSLYGTEWRERGYGLGKGATAKWNGRKELQHNGTGDRIGQRIKWDREQQNAREVNRM
jgi:hypothetical protein